VRGERGWWFRWRLYFGDGVVPGVGLGERVALASVFPVSQSPGKCDVDGRLGRDPVLCLPLGRPPRRPLVARLMRELGIRGVKKGRRLITTRRDDQAGRVVRHPQGQQDPAS
jgi:hypothetical protein